MNSIEDIIALCSGLPPARGTKWTVETLVPRRLHVSRGEDGAFAVFLEGSFETFGAMPLWNGVAHSSAVTALPSGQIIAVLRIVGQGGLYGNRAIAHIAYELGRQLASDPAVDNATLVASIAWLLPVLGGQGTTLSVERQYGLAGECVLLSRLLAQATRRGIGGGEVLKRWKGAGSSTRDFAAKGIAIEVKTTSHTARLHHFGSIEQLDPQSIDEEIFLFSIGMRRDASAPKTLPDFVEEVTAGLVTSAGVRDEDAVETFRGQCISYGYDPAYGSLYRTEAGFSPPHLPPTLYRETDLDRVRLTSFRDGRLPAMVTKVGYELEVQAVGLSQSVAESIFDRLLLASPLGGVN